MRQLFLHFFRIPKEDFIFKVFGPTHLLLIALMVFGCYFIIKHSAEIRNNPILSKKIKNGLFYILLIEQIFFYGWYLFSGVFSFAESLPLYSCRVAMICVLIGFPFNSRKAKAICIYWGIFGGVLAMVYPVLDPYYFPHFTNFTYFVGHLVLLWSAFVFLFVDRYHFTKKDYHYVLAFINIFLTIAFIVDLLSGGNYSYLVEAPFLTEIFGKLPLLVYTAMVFAAYNLLVFIIYRFGKKLNERIRSKIWEENRQN